MPAGYTDSVSSLIMQQPILEKLHFWMGSIVLLLLLMNGTLAKLTEDLALTGFGNNKAALRTVHAYLGSTALCLLFLHALLGLKLDLEI